ncbi:energy transducer TonB [Stenotrophomonas sp. Iso1]|uniref:energy transducer TonB n=1 Tax=Stenotrophomonas sp. Iso1 TaxID=2977283 RepID=UPI0022B79F58|nr:energy transducer TonB [Stenotrophomonas sp. Iso1]
MSSIPHDQASANTTTPHSGAVAAWLWVLLAASVVIGMLLFARHLAQPLSDNPSAVVSAPADLIHHTPVSAPQTANGDAEPMPGNPLPEYPAEALQAGIEGDVIARLQIDSNGRVVQLSIVAHEGATDPRLDDAAVTALRQWRFHPAMHDGQAVPSVVQVPVEFRTGR